MIAAARIRLSSTVTRIDLLLAALGCLCATERTLTYGPADISGQLLHPLTLKRPCSAHSPVTRPRLTLSPFLHSGHAG